MVTKEMQVNNFILNKIIFSFNYVVLEKNIESDIVLKQLQCLVGKVFLYSSTKEFLVC